MMPLAFPAPPNRLYRPMHSIFPTFPRLRTLFADRLPRLKGTATMLNAVSVTDPEDAEDLRIAFPEFAGCQWHGGRRDRFGFLACCGAATRPGSSYCDAHHPRVWFPFSDLRSHSKANARGEAAGLVAPPVPDSEDQANGFA